MGTPRSLAAGKLDDPIPAEGHCILDHGLILAKILKNTELINFKLGRMQMDLYTSEDGDVDTSGTPAFQSMQPVRNQTMNSREEAEKSTAPSQFGIAAEGNTERSLTKSKQNVTAVWVDFVDSMRPDCPRLGEFEFPSSKGSKSRDIDWISFKKMPDNLSRLASPRLDGISPTTNHTRRIVSPLADTARLDELGGLQPTEVSDETETEPASSKRELRGNLAPVRTIRKHTRRAASNLLHAWEHAQGLHKEDPSRSEEQSTRASIKQILSSPEALQVLSCTMILSHIIYMGFEAELGLKAAKRGEAEPDWFFKGDVAFACLFTIELFLRVRMDGLTFVTGKEAHFNLFDAFLLMAQLADILFAILNLGFLRAVRILRLLRAARAMRTAHYFTELRIMVTSIVSTLTSLFWAFLLLLMVLYLSALAIMQIVEYHVREEPDSMAEDVGMRHDTYELYGSLGASLLTLFMSISGGADWIDLVKPLTQFSKAYVLIYVLYVSFVVFGVMNVLTAIFVESANQIAAIDQDLAIQEQLRKDKSTISTIKAMFYEADVDNSGVLSQSELETLLENPKYIWAMRLVGVDVSEARGLFQLLDINETKAVSIDEFVTGMMRLKGGAKGVDLATLIYENKRMYAHLHDSLLAVQQGMSQLEQNVGRATIVSRQEAAPPRKRSNLHVRHSGSGRSSGRKQTRMDDSPCCYLIEPTHALDQASQQLSL